MDELNSIKEMIKRRVKVGTAIISSGYTPCSDEDQFPLYFYQISRTLGLEKYGHPELETLITLSVNNGGSSILRYLVRCVESGQRFMRGQRFVIPRSIDNYLEYVVEFQPSNDEYGFCLRAVVIGIEEEYQSMPSENAYEFLASTGELLDPYD